MSLQENKEAVLRFIEQVENRHNLDALDEIFSPNFIDHSSMTNTPGLDGTKEFFKMMFEAFPDMHFRVSQQLAEDDRVMTYKVFHGTHMGHFMGIPPTGKQVSTDTIDIFTVIHGKITEHWTVSDMLSLFLQLDALTLPKAKQVLP